MNRWLRNIAFCFSAGCIGGLANSIVVWLAGYVGLTVALGVSIAPALTAAWLYPRIVWGGIWGLLFLIPVLMDSPVRRGLLLSLGPTAVQLFVIFPIIASKSFFGLQLGPLTPLLVTLFNAVWGVTTAVLLDRIARSKG